MNVIKSIAVFGSLGVLMLATTTTHSQAIKCDGQSISSRNNAQNNPSQRLPVDSDETKFRSALDNVKSLQFPTSGHTCLNDEGGSKDVTSRRVSSRFYRNSSNNLVFNFPDASASSSNRERIELRGNTFYATRSSGTEYKYLRMKVKVPHNGNSGHSERYAIGQLFHENGPNDAAKLFIRGDDLYIDYNDGDDELKLGPAPRNSFYEVELRYKQRTSTGRDDRRSLRVRYRWNEGSNRSEHYLTLHHDHYDHSNDKLYFKAGCYPLPNDGGDCRVEMSSLRLDD